jgi:ubiquitin C-terminal hydrolase
MKKLDLWRLPEILVVHLKRFSYDQYLKNKLETFVDFPVDDLDFSTYIAHKNSQLSTCYMLYAISNHYGGLGGGHYTASVHVSGVSSVLRFIYLIIIYYFYLFFKSIAGW